MYYSVATTIHSSISVPILPCYCELATCLLWWTLTLSRMIHRPVGLLLLGGVVAVVYGDLLLGIHGQ